MRILPVRRVTDCPDCPDMFFDCAHLANNLLAFVLQWKEDDDEMEALQPKGANTQDTASWPELLSPNSRKGVLSLAGGNIGHIRTEQSSNIRTSMYLVGLSCYLLWHK